MNAFILGKKGTTRQVFDEKGIRIPVTSIDTSPCYVAGIRRFEVDGYWAVLLGYGKMKTASKTREGALKKAGIETPLRFLREIRFKKSEPVLIEKDGAYGIKIGEVELYPGTELKPTTLFQKDQMVNVQGVSKGKGFQGVVKRHGFAGGPRTHGQSDRERAPGSIGQSTTPGRVYKGKRMAGRMGNDTITIKNLRVVEANETQIMIKGLVPGPKGTLITVISS